MFSWILFGLSAWYFYAALVALLPVIVFMPVIVVMGVRELFVRALAGK
jgi:hypothetical protein